ncbi:spermidine/putrescine ABC transporter substrate-binding protein [Microbacterium sp. G2-8]|uniref:spermidine/putrescine ABC transporter substrate-binding protein n=1 Tax=Microbacterium sp. G2-8 TaxID=2842454 RepID=UPI001C891645|nr:spermidine/putrescine ABC transporter substrate-binding protein [Microbacterium sp. G2-8]
MERSLETRVNQAVEAWLRWLPRWEPATHRGRRSPCRRCLGSPVLRAAGLDEDAPHGVQHGLSTRIKTIIDQRVAGYTEHNLPLLQAELDQQSARNQSRTYRPREDLDPEFDGLPLDPEPAPGQPFLFTIAGFEEEAARDAPPLPPLSEDAKAALRHEVALADEYANEIGRDVCRLLATHSSRIRAAVSEFVDPQVDALLKELTTSLDAPFDPRDLGRGS